MKFDITKVVYITYEGKLSSTVKIGTKGYFADTLTNLRYYVEKECKNYYDEVFQTFNTERGYPFYFVNKVHGYDLFYSVEYPKENKYRPYIWEEREYLRGKWVKWINSNNEEKEFQITNMEFLSNDGFIINNGITPEILLDMAQFLDGSPCGMPIGKCIEIKKE